jgi:hypothetical protein
VNDGFDRNLREASGKRKAVKRKVVRKHLPDEGFLNVLGTMGLAKGNGDMQLVP